MNMEATSEGLTEANRWCAQVVRNRARNFWFGLRSLPEPKRSAMYAVYAWMRLVDDVADNTDSGLSVEDRRTELQVFQETTARVFDGKSFPSEPLWIAFARKVETCQPPRVCFDEMIQGQMLDLEFKPYHNWPALREYCYHAASTVGLICVHVWGFDDPEAETLAIDRGIAFQMTNILRDIREDAERGRCYLPLKELKAAGIDLQTLLDWSSPGRCRLFMRAQMARARKYYIASNRLEEMISPDCRSTSRAMNDIYHGLLAKITRNPQQAVGMKRVRLGSLRKMTIAMRARFLARSGYRK